MQVINDREAAEFLGVAVQTLRNWRFKRLGPPYIRLGRRIVYSTEDLKTYLNQHRIDPQNN